MSCSRRIHGQGMEGMTNKYKILVVSHEGKRVFGRLKRRWENNFKMDFKEMGYKV
jgi:hypothetical protein